MDWIRWGSLIAMSGVALVLGWLVLAIAAR